MRAWRPRRIPARSRAPANFQQQLGRRLACRRLAAIRSHGRLVRPECGRRPIQKARDRFPGAGFNYFGDGDDMPVICPTCQTLKLNEANARARLLKALHRRRLVAASFGRFRDGQRCPPGCILFVSCGVGLSCTVDA